MQFSIGTRAVVRSSRHRPFCFHNSFYQKYATRISVCVIAVRKLQEFLLNVRRLSLFFSTTTPTPSRRRVVIFSTTTQGIRLRRRVDVLTSDTRSDRATVKTLVYLKLMAPESKSARSYQQAYNREGNHAHRFCSNCTAFNKAIYRQHYRVVGWANCSSLSCCAIDPGFRSSCCQLKTLSPYFRLNHVCVLDYRPQL